MPAKQPKRSRSSTKIRHGKLSRPTKKSNVDPDKGRPFSKLLDKLQQAGHRRERDLRLNEPDFQRDLGEIEILAQSVNPLSEEERNTFHDTEKVKLFVRNWGFSPRTTATGVLLVPLIPVETQELRGGMRIILRWWDGESLADLISLLKLIHPYKTLLKTNDGFYRRRRRGANAVVADRKSIARKLAAQGKETKEIASEMFPEEYNLGVKNPDKFKALIARVNYLRKPPLQK